MPLPISQTQQVTRTRTYVAASIAAGVIVAVSSATAGFVLGNQPAPRGTAWPADLRAHIVSTGPDGLDTATIRTDLTAADPAAVEICEHALTSMAGATVVTVTDSRGVLAATGRAGICQPVQA